VSGDGLLPKGLLPNEPLSKELAERYFVAPHDPETDLWCATHRPHGALATAAQRILRRFTSDFEANALLGMYSLHLGGTETYRALLGSDRTKRGRLLDIGAGTGEVTEKLVPLFSEVRATETSPAMARRVRSRGVPCEVADLALENVALEQRALGTFDAVALLNVLDRTSRPQTLLDRALDHLLPGGTLIVASPLPARPHVDVGGASADPDEVMGGAGDTFEEALVDLVRVLLVPRDLSILRWTRLPYRSQGDRDAPSYEHDDVLMACTR
jgi:SAM-dependent methyltransferase